MLYPVSTEITEHDMDTDVESWEYEDREVFRGNVDPEYLPQGLNVYWLYDDDNIRIGLAEHEKIDQNTFAILWFKENPFATLFQQDGWEDTGETIWSKMTSEAYSDCLAKNINTPEELIKHYPAMKGKIITTSLLNDKQTAICLSCYGSTCKKKLGLHTKNPYLYFIDDDFVIYKAPMQPSHDDDHPSEPLLLGLVQELEPPPPHSQTPLPLPARQAS